MTPTTGLRSARQAIFRRRRHQPKRPTLAMIRPGSPAPAMGPGARCLGKSVLTVEGQHACRLVVGCTQPSDDELTTASRQDEKTNAREDQARQSSTDDGARDSHAVERKGRVKRSLASDVGADPQPIGLYT